jgi:hypothetical protein
MIKSRTVARCMGDCEKTVGDKNCIICPYFEWNVMEDEI